MILLVLVALCVITVPLTGGRLQRLADLQLRWLWLGPGAIALQVLIITIAPGGNRTLHALIHTGTYALVGAFLWANRRIVGARTIGLGAVTNTIAIIANGGVMPASITAQRLAGLTQGAAFNNSAALAHPNLLWLGDIIPVPGPLPNVLSIGDCIIFTGMLMLLHRTCRTPSPGHETDRRGIPGAPNHRRHDVPASPAPGKARSRRSMIKQRAPAARCANAQRQRLVSSAEGTAPD